MVAAENLSWSDNAYQPQLTSPVALLKALRAEVHAALLETGDLRDLQGLSEYELYERIRGLTRETAQSRGLVLTAAMLERVQGEVFAELRGFGPLQSLLDDGSVTEIMVNGAARVFVERSGKLEACDVSFTDDSHLMRIIDKIISPLGRRVLYDELGMETPNVKILEEDSTFFVWQTGLMVLGSVLLIVGLFFLLRRLADIRHRKALEALGGR